MSVLKAQLRQRISNIYIYLYVSDQSVSTGSKALVNSFLTLAMLKPDIFCFKYSVDPIQLASDQDPRCFLLCL